MICSIKEAQLMILKKEVPLKEEEVSLHQARGRILAEEVLVLESIPPYPISCRDGYALKGEDTCSPPSFLKVVGRITAGESSVVEIKEGETVGIMTGALLPFGANAVVEKETVFEEGGVIKVVERIEPGRFITPKGYSLKRGSIIPKGGYRINPPLLSKLALLGKERIKVYRRPEVGILTTGNELVELGEAKSLGEMVNSNAFLLGGLVEEAGGIPRSLGIAKDDVSGIISAIKGGSSLDLLLTTGGIGRGDHDLMAKVWDKLGLSAQLRRILAIPGKRLLYGYDKDLPIFSLPGSPGALLVFFIELIRPFLYKLQGLREGDYRQALLTDPVENRSELTKYLLGSQREKDHVSFIKPLPKGSPLLPSLDSNALIQVPPKTILQRGELVAYKCIPAPFPFSSVASRMDL